ncbi:sigma 54-interacting transcriptional regulator [Eubacterium multiforme]|uniref:Transcriptional regulatory protein LevR/transcriptional regulator with AAA-type ATPase domain n=1 Tax=Eubacterium multiforme TaxID=83339 RepID=A0ABT9UQE5_9FIRM|nr:sigma-54-dependent transcriptional regulator [Eubacterium multiforme]MDQ0148857.1 transcriptional regulatory protein LevR/transcriptional regulator with AAA-type ATPase domain [Eubacterium multiforme]
MSKITEVYNALLDLQKGETKGITAKRLSEFMNLNRANVSRYLNQLYSEGKVSKEEGRPVKYSIITEITENKIKSKNKREIENLENNSLDRMVGAKQSLQIPIQQAKAAMMYPPRGLHTIILGETGVGKSMFAELMYEFAKEDKLLDKNAPFVRFNCADYADNPQLVIAQIFGVKKGAYTGADKDKEGLLKKANGGIIFLDEIHRLSPQGQEMLFTYIDKGYFRPLGDTENPIFSDAQIIAATTEEPKSYLLKTFTRRIPMTITLPSLKERSATERYHLLEQFIKGESKRLGESIYFNKNALISFLLYDCPNNIGQLKSDIQLACAKAFLNYKASSKDFIILDQSDLHPRVNKGLMKLQDNRKEIQSLLGNAPDILRFSYNDDNSINIFEKKEESIKEEYFYDIIENKLDYLKKKGMEEEEISQIINIDIESYFKKYIRDLPEEVRKEEVTKVVSEDIANMVEEILNMASTRLNREYDEKVYFGLALHLQGSIERIRQGNKIYHPKLNRVRVQYSDEFMIAMEAAKKLDNKFKIQVPLDEIGYLTMFIAAKPYDFNEKEECKVGVIVIMHGHSTASSMVEVSNKLIGEDYVVALDMPLSMKAEQMYEIAKEKIKEINKGKGVILLVDMGSLTNFGKMIEDEENIVIKTIDMVSTLTVIEAGRKALNGRSVEEIYKSCKEISKFGVNIENRVKSEKDKIIVTTCFTGEGSAEKLREIIIKGLDDSNILVKPLDILDKKKFIENINKLKKKKNILAIVGSINLNVSDIPFISAKDILVGDGIERLNTFISQEEDFQKITNSIDSQLEDIDGKHLVSICRNVVCDIQESLNIKISHEVSVGIVIHMCFLIEKILKGESRKKFENLNVFKNKYNRELILIRQSIMKLERNYDVNINEDDLAFIVRMFIGNTMSV